MRTLLRLATLSTLTAALALAGCAVIVLPDGEGIRYEGAFSGTTVQGNDQPGVDSRAVERAVTALDVSGALQVEVRVGAAPSLRVEGDSNLLPLVHTDVSGNGLRIWTDGGFRTKNALRVVLTTPELTQVNSTGSGRLAISGLNGQPLSLSQSGSRGIQLSGDVSRLDLRHNGSGAVNAAGLRSASIQASMHGSGRLELGQLRGDQLNLDLHGSGGVSASGAVRSVSVRLYGSGSAELSGLASQGAELSTYGSGSISAAVSQTLVAESSGSGRITVYGNPAQRTVSGKHVSVLQ